MNLKGCTVGFVLLSTITGVVSAADWSILKTGNASYFAGDYLAAEISYSSAITNDAAWALAYNNRGLARFHQGNFAGADADFDVAKGMDTNYVSPCVNKGKSLTAQRRFSEAVTELQAGLALTTNNAGLYFNLAWAYDEQELYSQAISNYTAALGLNSSYQRARLGRGVSYAKQGAASNAITDFYAVINDAPSGDMLTAIAAYDLQLLRGPGLNFNTDNGATNFIKGIFSYSTEQYDAAITNLSVAQASEPVLADIPWMTSWSYIGNRDTNRANGSLAQAYALMQPLTVRSIGNPADIFIDGIKRGTSPTTLRLFSNGYDLTLRRAAGSTNQEWVGVTYTDGTPGGSNVMLINPVTVTNLTRFGPVADTDRDWLADAWEMRWFGDLTHGPQDDETDHDGVSNLQEFWASTDPTRSDTDGDGFSDFAEIYVYGTDPTVPNRLYYVNDGSTNNDEWCTASGNDANDGLSPATPKATVQAIVDSYALKSGDFVLIDTGTYNLTNNIRVTAADSGSSDAPLTFMASPYGVTISRGNTANGNYVWELNGANYVTLTTATGTKHPGLAQNWMKAVQGYNGIWLQSATGCRVSRCEAYGNGYSGIYINSCAAVTVANCISRGCTDPSGGDGIRVEYGSGITVSNCTIQGNSRIGMSFTYSGGYTAVNNVVCQGGSGNMAFYSYGSSASLCDYNNLWATNGATVGWVDNVFYPTLPDWRAITGADGHSLNRDPLFVDANSGDFHLQSTVGSYHGGLWQADSTNSPCIDAGQPNSLILNEPAPNGNRVNLGAYGNTTQASMTPLGRILVLLSPVGTEVWRGTNSIIWLATGQGWGSNDTVRLEYSLNGGVGWTTIAGASGLPYSAGSFAWDTTTVPSLPVYLVRVAYNGAPAVQDTDRTVFVVHNTGISYYVNDTSRAADIYCTAIGNDGNSGLSPNAPKASVQAVLDAYPLRPGDTVLVDAGVYNLTNNVTLTSADSGSDTNYVRIVGARNAVTGTLTTWINRNSRASGAACFRIESGDGFSLEQMRLSGSSDGVYFAAHDGGHRLKGLEMFDNNGWAVNAAQGRVLKLLMDHCLLWNNGGGVYHYGGYGGSGLTVSSCTIVQDWGTGIYWNYSPVVLSNNIVVASGSGTRCLDWSSFGSVVSDYNDLYVEWGAQLSSADADLVAWRAARAQDVHSLSLAPLFVDDLNGDYHLQSTGGSWHSGAWLADPANSSCIDSGDPLAPPGDESLPNGGRLNLGAFGGTVQASRTPAGQVLALLAPLGGEVWRGTNNIMWLATGQGWTTNDTVRLEYSLNRGFTWLPITGASALPYGTGLFSWDTTTEPTSAGYLLRAFCNRTLVQDATRIGFTIHNNALVYYVNDGVRANDVYCTAVGNDANDGLSAAAPKASVQAILDAYDLEPGDTVLVDAGVYNLTNNITLTAADSGSGTNYVRIVGARNAVTGALTTWINRNSRASGAACFRIEGGDGYSLEQMRLSGSSDGVYFAPLDGSHRLISLELFDNNGWAVNASQGRTLKVTMDHCLLWNNGGGVYHYGGYGGSSLTVSSCTIVQDWGTGIYWNYSPVVLSNNIVVASGSGTRCLDWSSFGSVVSDYNDLYVEWGAQLSSTYANLAAWRAARAQDMHSLSLDPLFVDDSNGDYHLQSTGGSWHGGAWMADAGNSPCIDTGNPTSDYSQEPYWNGANIDMGAYGNTAQSSKSVDSDHDGLSDTMEIYRYGTNPNNPDSDGDGIGDQQEIAQGTDPNNAASWLTFIAGNVSYAGSETGAVYVVASPGSFTNRVVCLTNSSAVVSISPVSLPDAHTLEAWALLPLPATPDGWRTLFQAASSHHHIIVDSSGALGVYFNQFYSSGYNLGSLAAGWHLISAVCASNQTRFFIDGNQVGSSGASETMPVAYLGNAGGANQSFGMADEFRIWNRALSAEEIRVSMRRTIFGVEPRLLGYWNFDDGTARDRSGRANDGVLMNGAVVTEAGIPYFPAYAVALAAPGSYCISNLPNFGPYTVSGFRDQNDNGFKEIWEPQGFSAQNPVAVIPLGVTNVNLSLSSYEFQTVYQTDFESGADAHWSSSLTSSNEAFTSFLGRFGNQPVTLTITNLPSHDMVRLGFDFYCIDTWDGNAGPDWFGLSNDVARAWTFSFNNGPHTYPGVPDSVGQFGFSGYQDSIYRQLRDNNLGHGFVFGHTGSTLRISFYGQGLQSLDDESWGIDNVHVEISGAFRIHSISGSATSGIRITWGSISNQFYSVERTSNLSVGFTNVAENIPSTPPENVYLDTSATNGTSFFYRIKVLP